ncbi:MAG: DUF6320 domain-containing protein [Bacteroidota bacterium]
MKICSNCKVELEEHMNYCPLCGTPANTELDSDSKHINEIKKHDRKNFREFHMLDELQRRKLLWEIAGIILLSAILVTLIIDLLSNGQITWSKYSITVCLVLFVNTTILRFMPGNLYVIMAGSLVSTSALLLLLDVYEGNQEWSLSLGIPILFMVYIIGFVFILIVQNLKEKGLNLIAYILLLLALLSFFLEGIIALHMWGQIALEWSLVVLASLLPASALLFFIHYRLKKGTELKRFFHI